MALRHSKQASSMVALALVVREVGERRVLSRFFEAVGKGRVVDDRESSSRRRPCPLRGSRRGTGPCSRGGA